MVHAFADLSVLPQGLTEILGSLDVTLKGHSSTVASKVDEVGKLICETELPLQLET